MKHLLLILFTACCCTAIAAPLSQGDAKALEVRVAKVSAAFDAADVETIVEMTHPSLFKIVGGKEKMIALTKSAMAQMKERDVRIVESKLGSPSEVYEAADELVCFYPRTTVISAGEIKMRSIGFLICIREAKGGEWLFLDGSGLRKNPGLLRTLLPSLPSDVGLPENKVEPIE